MLTVFLVVSLICGKFLLDYWQDSYDNRQNYRQVEEIAFPENTTEEDETEPNADNSMTETEIDDFDYRALLDENADCIGWLKIDGINISYPVVQGKDNEFYLHHDFQKNYAICGTLMLDFRNDIDATFFCILYHFFYIFLSIKPAVRSRVIIIPLFAYHGFVTDTSNFCQSGIFFYFQSPTVSVDQMQM